MPQEDGSLVTVVLAPREKYSVARTALERLLTMRSTPFELVVVDDIRASRGLRRWLARQAEEQCFEYVSLDHCAGVNEARMEGFSRAQTCYVVFLDNDVWVHDGAIEALVRCAEETGASAVAPTYCIGARDADLIHHAFGNAHIAIEEGHPRLHESTRFANRRLQDVRQELGRAPCKAIELHCALVRVDDLREAGGLDVGLGSSMDCIDLALRAQAYKGVWFEPAAVVTYDDASPKLSDLRLYLDRWSSAQVEHDIERLIDEWQLDPMDPQFDLHREVLGRRRWKPLSRTRKVFVRLLGRRTSVAARRFADQLVDRGATIRKLESRPTRPGPHKRP